MTPGVRFHIVMPPELLERVDSARGPGQSRGDWVRRAVERALGNESRHATSPSPVPAEQLGAVEQASVQSPAPAPAEQPRRSRREHLPSCKCPVCS